MISPKYFDDYVEYLHQVLKERNSKNPNYSLRAFARDIDLSPARLSEVLRGKGDLGVSKLQSISERLCSETSEQEFFKNLVVAKVSRNTENQKKALAYLKLHKEIHEAQKIAIDDFELMSEWYYLGIWNYILLGKNLSEDEIISEFPDVDESKIKACLNTLNRLDLIDLKNNKYQTNANEIHAIYDFSSFAVRKYHQSMLRKAEQCLLHQNIDERYFYSKITSLNPEQYSKLTNLVSNFIESVPQKLQVRPSDENNSVHAVNFQIFRLNKTREL
jgi:uncharacterized protein (TIGR02147 family)